MNQQDINSPQSSHQREAGDSLAAPKAGRTGKSTPRRPGDVRGAWLSAALVGGLAVAFGWPTLSHQFLHGDDQRFVTEHFLVRHPSWAHALELLTIVHDDLRQPLPMLSFMLDAARSGVDGNSGAKLSPRPFHETNVALHVINSILAFCVLRRLLQDDGAALVAGALFAVHPFALEAVAWVSGRMILLSSTFALAAMLMCLRRREPGGGTIFAALVLWIGSLLSKVLPAVPLALAAIDREYRGSWSRRVLIAAGLMLALGAAVSLEQRRHTLAAGFDQRSAEESAIGKPIELLMAVGYYLSNYAVPAEQAAWHPPSLESPSAGQIARAIAGIGLCGIAFVWGLRVDRRAATGIFVFAALLAPFLMATLSRRMFAADRYMYLPVLGLHATAAVILLRLCRPLGSTSSGLRRFVAFGAAAALVLAALVRSLALAPAFYDSASAYERVAQVYPDNVLVRAELAKAYNFVSQPMKAISAVDAARGRWLDHPRLALAAGDARLQLDDKNAALFEYQFAARHMPAHLVAQTRLAALLNSLGRFDEAAAVYQRVLRDVQPDHLPSLTGLGFSMMQTHRLDEAERLFRTALSINPHLRDARFHLGNLQLQRRAYEPAAEQFRRILDVDSVDAPARFNLGVALAGMGRHEEALAAYDMLASQNPDDAGLAINRAETLVRLDHPQKAQAVLEAFLERRPSHLAATVRLHRLLVDTDRADALPRVWRHYAEADGAIQENGFLAWAYALAGDSAACEDAAQSAAGEGEGEGEAAFAMWAQAFLRLGDSAAGLDALFEAIPMNAPADIRTGEHIAIIDQALGTFMEQAMTPQLAYVLARRSLFFGDEEVATGQLKWILENAPAGDPWRERAESLLTRRNR